MATGVMNQFLEHVDEKVLECTICFKRLQNPKSLRCLHSFCLVCLEGWVKRKGKLTCPTCSKSYRIPEGGLQKLPPNTFINNLLETIEQFSERDQMKCVCGKEGKYYCQDCRHYLCSTCKDHHKILPVSANHKLHTVEDVRSMTPQHFASLHTSLCLLHSKHLEFYCIDCKIPICVNCSIMGHKDCKGKQKPISISEAFQTLKKTSAALEKSAQHYKNKLQYSLKAVIHNATKLKQSKDSSLRGIDNHVQEMVKKIKENGDKVKNNVETIYKNKKKITDVQIDELRTTISDINTKLSLLNHLLKSDEATAMQSSETVITALKDRIHEMPETEPKDNGQIYFLINKHQQCDIGNVTEFRALADCLTLKGGESVTQGQTIVVRVIKTDHCEIYANQLKATWTQPTGETYITQVEEDDNGDHIVTGKCTSTGVCKLDVNVDGEPIKQSPMTIIVMKKGLVNTIKILNQNYVRDVVKCEDDCLLISCLTNEIHKYKQSGEYIGKVSLPQGVKVYRMYKMKNGNIVFSDNGNRCISILCNSRVIKSIGKGVLKDPQGIHVDEASNVVYVAEWDGCVFMLDIYSGKMIRRIGSQGNQEGHMSEVIDVTLTNRGHLLVLEYSNNILQLFHNEGSFIKVLVKAGDENGKVRYPCGVVVDKDDNIIISSTHKLQLFSSDGNFIKRIDEQKDRIKWPWGLSTVSYHPRKVAVANNGNQTVKILNY